MIRSLRRTLHPAWYQGHGKNAPYFEGWYYKLIDASEQHRLAVVPGIFTGARVPESLRATVTVQLSMPSQGTSRLLSQGIGRNAGLEVVGEISKLLG
jgi:hypothetical protein